MNTKLLTTNFAIDYTECYQVADGYAGMSHPDVSFADANCLIFNLSDTGPLLGRGREGRTRLIARITH